MADITGIGEQQMQKEAIASLSKEVIGLMTAKAAEHGKNLVSIEDDDGKYGMGFELPYESNGMKDVDQLWISQDKTSLDGWPMKMPGLRLNREPRVTSPEFFNERFNIWLSLKEGETTDQLDEGPDHGLGDTDAIKLLTELKGLLTQKEAPPQPAV
jgi:hypothetical protein